MRKMTQQLIKRMMGSVEVNISSSQDRTFLAVDCDSDLGERTDVSLSSSQYLVYLATGGESRCHITGIGWTSEVEEEYLCWRSAWSLVSTVRS